MRKLRLKKWVNALILSLIIINFYIILISYCLDVLDFKLLIVFYVTTMAYFLQVAFNN